ncbi:hypothetical protein BN1708_019902, partial [Verticillium longisporum]
RPIL